MPPRRARFSDGDVTSAAGPGTPIRLGPENTKIYRKKLNRLVALMILESDGAHISHAWATLNAVNEALERREKKREKKNDGQALS